MDISCVQTRCQDGWTRIEPYILPTTIAVGVAVVINQIWGSFAACGFAAACLGSCITFPFLITEVTKQDMAISIARLTLIAVLPFFGTWGILASVALAAASAFTQDIRLYNIRSMIKEANAIADEIKRDRESLLIARKELIEECEAKNKSAQEFWSNARPLKEVNEQIARYKALTEQNKAFFDEVIEGLHKQGETSAADKLVATLDDLRLTIDVLAKKFVLLEARVDDHR